LKRVCVRCHEATARRKGSFVSAAKGKERIGIVAIEMERKVERQSCDGWGSKREVRKGPGNSQTGLAGGRVE
jgi:hypothetical protein